MNHIMDVDMTGRVPFPETERNIDALRRIQLNNEKRSKTLCVLMNKSEFDMMKEGKCPYFHAVTFMAGSLDECLEIINTTISKDIELEWEGFTFQGKYYFCTKPEEYMITGTFQ